MRVRGICGVRIVLTALLFVLPRTVPAEQQRGVCSLRSPSDEHQDLLTRYGILKVGGCIIVDVELVHSQATRILVTQLIEDGLSGSRFTDDDRKFVRQHQVLVGKVLGKVWPAIGNSPAFPSDGALSSEKWVMLEDPALDRSTVEALVIESIKDGGLWGSAAQLMFRRRLPRLLPILNRVAGSAQADVTERLYAIGVLSAMGEKPDVRMLELAIKDVQLDDAQVESARRLRSRLTAGAVASWKDVEGLVVDD